MTNWLAHLNLFIPLLTFHVLSFTFSLLNIDNTLSSNVRDSFFYSSLLIYLRIMVRVNIILPQSNIDQILWQNQTWQHQVNASTNTYLSWCSVLIYDAFKTIFGKKEELFVPAIWMTFYKEMYESLLLKETSSWNTNVGIT